MLFPRTGTALAGSDYTPASIPLQFPAGSGHNDTQCIDVDILDNSILEDHETFNVMLDVITSHVMEGSVTTTVTIRDDDSEYMHERFHCYVIMSNTMISCNSVHTYYDVCC